MKRLALTAAICMVLLFGTAAYGQQTDIAIGASTIFSSKYGGTASQAFLPASEKGGIYGSFSFEHVFQNRLGFSAEVATRAKQALYNGYQGYRPIFYDFNGVFAPRVGENTWADLMAGVGGESLLFYNRYTYCYYSSGCLTHINSDHFLVHVGAGLRYYAWRQFFVRPEVHFYRVLNNSQFNSNNVVRAGVSLGYTFGSQ